jgi:deoxyribodipyrimidine photo-lyase
MLQNQQTLPTGTTQMQSVPDVRIHQVNNESIRRAGQFVVYWMTASRRLSFNFALDRALEHCRALQRPLLILEPLRCDYRWASRRLHAFAIQGMRDNAAEARKHGHAYAAWVERSLGGGTGLIQKIAAESCVIVTDDYPCFFLPQMVRAVGRHLPVLLEAVDSNGLLPMRATDQIFPTAYAFRRFLQKQLTPHLSISPETAPLADPGVPRLQSLPATLSQTPGLCTDEELADPAAWLDAIPIDQSVLETPSCGGTAAAHQCLHTFLTRRLSRYGEERNEPDADVASGLSPWLHFGHISVHEVFQQLADRERWNSGLLADPRQTRGSRNGWWGMSESAESFLDELVTWRELGFNMCWQDRRYDRWESLPDWARKTLHEHAADRRPETWTHEQLEAAGTGDRIWNAAQRQLLREGRMQNYLRMLWGKKVLEWSPQPQQALKSLIELNNKYALDGRDPNSYSGIFWVFGRYDRAWGPERKIFGKIRYMTSDSTAKKLDLKRYLQTWGR